MGTKTSAREELRTIAQRVMELALPEEWRGIDAVRPLLEKIADEGGIVVLKWDGERTQPGDAGRYTVVVSRGGMGDDAYRTDCATLEDAVARAIVEYAARAWR